ncbi:MAG: polysaccharide deacetylase family protein, partial [Bacteroidia bacterium]
MKWFHVPVWVDAIFPRRVWRVPTNPLEKNIYLTFDDGPTANLTDWILSELEKYNAKATFFCVGGNMQKFPSTLKQIESLGHTIGNHTFSHLNGFKSATNPYIEDVKNASRFHQTKMFRPPYGKLR